MARKTREEIEMLLRGEKEADKEKTEPLSRQNQRKKAQDIERFGQLDLLNDPAGATLNVGTDFYLDRARQQAARMDYNGALETAKTRYYEESDPKEREKIIDFMTSQKSYWADQSFNDGIDADIARLRQYDDLIRTKNEAWNKYSSQPDFLEKSQPATFSVPEQQNIVDYARRNDNTAFQDRGDGRRYNVFGEEVAEGMGYTRRNGALVADFPVEDVLGLYKAYNRGELGEAYSMVNGTSVDPYQYLISTMTSASLDYLKPEEEQTYYYLLNTQGSNAALEYLDGITWLTNMREQEANQQRIENMDGWELALYNVASVPGKVLGDTVGMLSRIDQSKGRINPYAKEFALSDSFETVRGETASRLDDMTGEFELLGVSLGDVYQAGMSSADSLFGAATMGGCYTLFMGGSAAISEARKLAKQGASNEQIFWGSVLAGAAESVFEKVSIDHLIKMRDANTISQVIKNTLKQGAIEGSEEFFTEISNMITNGIVMGSQSDMEMAVQALMQNGLSREAAEGQYIFETLWDAGMGGFLSGGFSGAPMAISVGMENAGNTRAVGADINAQDGGYAKLRALANDVAGVGTSVQTRQQRAIEKQISRANKKQTDRRVGRLSEKLDSYRTSQNRTDIAKLLVSDAGMGRVTASNAAATISDMMEGTADTLTEERFQKLMKNADVAKVVESLYNADSTVYKRNTQDLLGRFGTPTQETNALQGEGAVQTERTQTITNAESSYKVNENGIDITEDGEVIQSMRPTGRENGKLMVEVNTDSGTKTVRAESIDFRSQELSLLYGVADLMGVSADTAQEIINSYDSGQDVEKYLTAVQELYTYGNYGMDSSRAQLISALTDEQRVAIYGRGRIDAEIEADRRQNAIDSLPKAAERRKGGVVYEGNMEDYADLNEIRKGSVEALRRLGESLGIRFHIYKSYVSKDGKRVYSSRDGVKEAPNGFYQTKNGEIWIDINAGENGQGVVLFTAAHELTHFIRQWSPKKFKVLADFLVENYGKQEKSVDALVAAQQRKAKKNGETLTYDEAFEEVVADAMETMLTDGEAAQKLSELRAKDHALWAKIRDWFKDFARKIRELYKDLNPDSYEGRLVRQVDRTVQDKLQELFFEGLADAADAYSSVDTSAEKNKSTTEDGGVKCSIRHNIVDVNGNVYDTVVVLDKKISPRTLHDRKRFIKYIETNLLGLMIPVVDEDGNQEIIEFAKENERVTKNGKSHKVVDKIKRIEGDLRKIVVVNSIEAVSASKYNPTLSNFENSHGWMDANGWEIRTAFVMDKSGMIYKADFQIAHSYDGRNILYSVNIKEKEGIAVAKSATTADAASGKSAMPSDGDFITNLSTSQEPNVKKSSRNNAQLNAEYMTVDSNGRHLSEEQQKFFRGSKVRDRDGRLLTVFHGTNAEFDRFEMSKAGQNGRAEGFGFYFTDDRDITNQYGGRQIEAYLDIKKPLYNDRKTISKSDVKKFAISITDAIAEKYGESWKDGFISNYIDTYSGISKTAAAAQFVSLIWEDCDSDQDLIYEIANGSGMNYGTDTMEEFYAILKKSIGADGNITIWENGDRKSTIYVAFSPEQVKYVDNRTPTTNPDMRLSRRGGALTTQDSNQANDDHVSAVQSVVADTEKKSTTGEGSDESKYVGGDLANDPKFYTYEFLTHLKPSNVVFLPEISEIRNELGKIDRGKIIENANSNAQKIGTVIDGKTFIKNNYTGVNIRFDTQTIRHSLNGDPNRLLTNARLASVAGEVIRSAVPINALYNRANVAIGTYAMAAFATDSMGREFVAIVTVEQRSNSVKSFELVDVAHSISGRQKKGSQVSTKLQGVYPIKATTVNVSQLIDVVNSTYKGILSKDVLNNLGEEKNGIGGYFSESKFSLRGGAVTTRDLLLQMDAAKVENQIEQKHLRQYQEKARQYDEQQAIIGTLTEDLRELRSGTGKRSASAIRIVQEELRKAENRSNIFAGQMTRMEQSFILQRVLNRDLREKTDAVEKEWSEANKTIEQLRRENTRLMDQLYAKEVQKAADTAVLRQNYEDKIKQTKKHYQEARKKSAELRGNTEIRHKIKKLAADLNARLLHPKEGRYVPKELTRATVELLDAVNMDNGRSEKLSVKIAYIKEAYHSLQEDPKYAITYDSVFENILFWFGKQVGDTPIGKMSRQQLETTYDILRAIHETIRDAVKVTIGQEERNAYELASEMISETRSVKKKDGMAAHWVGTSLRAETAFERFAGFKKNSAWSQVYKMLNDGQTRATQIRMEATQLFGELLSDANDRERNKALRKAAGQLLSTKKDDLVSDLGLVDEDGNAVPITRGMMLSLYMHLQNAQNTNHLIYGGLTVPELETYYKGKVSKAFGSGHIRVPGKAMDISSLNYQLREAETAMAEALEAGDTDTAAEYDAEMSRIEAQIRSARFDAQDFAAQLKNAIEEKMTDYERKWVSTAKQFFDVYSRNVLNEATEQMYHFGKAKVDNYFPIRTDPNYRTASFESISKDFSLENSGFMKERVEGASNPILLEDLTDVINSQVERISSYAGLAPVIRSFEKIYSKTQVGYQDSIQEAVTKTFGVQGKQYIENLLADLTGSRQTERSIADALRGNMAAATLTLNPRVALAQTASFPTAAAELGWKPLMKALAKIEKQDGNRYILGKAEKELIAKWSPLLWYRMQGYSSVEIGDVKSSQQFMAKTQKKLRWAMGWIQAMDGATVGRLWYASEYYVQDRFPALKKGSDDYYKKVAETFNRVVERTQPNYTVMQRPDILRNPNPLLKQLTMFMTQRLQNFNIVYESAGRWRRYSADYRNGINGVTKQDLAEARTEFRRAVVSQVAAAATIVAFKFLANAILHNMWDYRDDDDELTAESISLALIDAFADSLISSVLWGSEAKGIFTALYNAFSGNGKDTFEGFSIAGIENLNDGIQTVIDLVGQFGNLIRDEDMETEKLYRALKNAVFGASQVFGIPTKNAAKLFEGVWNHIKDVRNDGFFSFEAGVERTDSQNGRLLYQAMLEGNKEETKKFSAAFPDEYSVHKAIQEQLRDTDSRIYEAAQLRIRGDVAGYMRIVREIKKEGHFIQDDIVFAVNSAQRKIENAEKEDLPKELKPAALATPEDYLNAIDNNQAEATEEAKKAAIQYRVDSGKSAEEAANSFYSSVIDSIRERFGSGIYSSSRAVLLLDGYANMSKEDAQKRVAYWDFGRLYPEMDWSEDAVWEYNTEVKSSGISIKIYDRYLQGVKGCSGDNRQELIIKMIDRLPITREQKTVLFLLNYKEKNLSKTPWY